MMRVKENVEMKRDWESSNIIHSKLPLLLWLLHLQEEQRQFETALCSGGVWEITHFLTFYTEKIIESGRKQDSLDSHTYIHTESPSDSMIKNKKKGKKIYLQPPEFTEASSVPFLPLPPRVDQLIVIVEENKDKGQNQLHQPSQVA